MTQTDLTAILERHRKWLRGESGGEKADLICADLICADLIGADLSDADLGGANLGGANLRGANLDYASYPLSCKGLHLHIDDRLGVQLMYHAVSNILYSKNTSDQLKKEVSQIVDIANRFHRVDECGKLTKFEEHKEETE